MEAAPINFVEDSIIKVNGCALLDIWSNGRTKSLVFLSS
jgi:hypothetical protein